MSFQAAFYIGSEGVFGSMIRLIKHRGITHCGLLFSDGMMGTSVPSKGVCIREFQGHPANWIMVPLPAHCEAKARAFMEGEVGAGYDWKGILLAQLLPFGRQHPDLWFCSEICTEAIIQVGVFGGGLRSYEIDPAELHLLLVNTTLAGNTISC